MIDRFSGNYRFLSNFWPAQVSLDGLTYPTVEHAYQAAKTLDEQERFQILRANTPGDAKRLGRRVRKRSDWDEIKLDVMQALLKQKFFRNELFLMLCATKGQQLVEGNTWGDTFWGKCRGVGENHLGRLLMMIRDEPA